MSGTKTYYQHDQDSKSIPAARAVVMIEGRVCHDIEVAELRYAGNDKFSYVKLEYSPDLDTERTILSERLEDIAGMGREVKIYRVHNYHSGKTVIAEELIFVGYVERIKRKCDSKFDRVEITAVDYSVRMSRITIKGKRVALNSEESFFSEDLITVFNDSSGLAYPSAVCNKGTSGKIFTTDEKMGKRWSYAEIVHYLLVEYTIAGQLNIPDIMQIESVMLNRFPDVLNFQGITLLEAIKKCCSLVGVKFMFVPNCQPVGALSGIVFYKPGKRKSVELNCQFPYEDFEFGRTNILEIESDKNYWPVNHKFTGCGGFKKYEATFELIRAWDSSLEGEIQENYNPLLNPDFDEVKDVYRKWCLNEAGDYSKEPFNRGQAFDFSGIFDNASYFPIRRQFDKCISLDADNNSNGYYLEVSYDDGFIWQKFEGEYQLLTDQCGIWISENELAADFFSAVVSNTLKMRITASVQSDQRLKYSLRTGSVNSAISVVDKQIDLPECAYEKVTGKSIFFDPSLHINASTNDTQRLIDKVKCEVSGFCDVFESIKVTKPYAAMGCRPGDRVECAPGSRDILGIKTDSRSVFWVDKVVVDLKKQKSILYIKRARFYE